MACSTCLEFQKCLLHLKQLVVNRLMRLNGSPKDIIAIAQSQGMIHSSGIGNRKVMSSALLPGQAPKLGESLFHPLDRMRCTIHPSRHQDHEQDMHSALAWWTLCMKKSCRPERTTAALVIPRNI